MPRLRHRHALNMTSSDRPHSSSIRWIRYAFSARGPSFRPRDMTLSFAAAFHAGEEATFGGRRGEVVSYGAALYDVPDDRQRESRESDLALACAHLSALLPAFRAAGATEFILHIHRRFRQRCAEEFSRSDIRALAELDCHVFFVGEPLDEEAPRADSSS